MIDETIEIVPYDPAWQHLFEAEKLRIQKALNCPDASIEHFGSTAVPGMAAKPIIDILIGIPTLGQCAPLVKNLESIGYEFLGEAGIAGRLAFRRRSMVSFNLALVEQDSRLFRNNILIRDYLRQKPQAKQAYMRTKQEIIALGHTTLLAYSGHKGAFMRSLERDAKEFFGAAD